MSRITVQSKSNLRQVQAELAYRHVVWMDGNRRLTHEDRLMTVLLYLWWTHSRRHKRHRWYCIISNQKLADRCQLSRRHVIRLKALLEAQGYLKVTHRFRRSDGKQMSCVYSPGPLMLKELFGFQQSYPQARRKTVSNSNDRTVTSQKSPIEKTGVTESQTRNPFKKGG